MDKWQAQTSFWESFNVPAYEEHSVPDTEKDKFPRITYEAATGVFESLIPITASIWDRSTSWATVDSISNSIESYVKNMGCPEIDNGRYRVYIDTSNFARKMDDPEDDQIKRIVINVTFEFMTK